KRSAAVLISSSTSASRRTLPSQRYREVRPGRICTQAAWRASSRASAMALAVASSGQVQWTISAGIDLLHVDEVSREPFAEIGFRQAAVGQRHESQVAIFHLGRDALAIEAQEQQRYHQCAAFVAVDERMVAR